MLNLKDQTPYIAAAADYMRKYRRETADVSSYGAVYDFNGKPRAWGMNYPCHATMSYMDEMGNNEYEGLNGDGGYNLKPKVVFTFSKPREPLEPSVAFREYTKWLISENSPYRSLWKDHPEEGIVVGETDVTSDTFCTDIGFIFPDLDVPSNLLVNFMILARQENEHPDMVSSWYNLVKRGVNPALAALMGHSFHVKRDTASERAISHSALDSWSVYSPERVKNFTHGVVANPTELYSVDEEYQPCNDVWGGELSMYPVPEDLTYRGFLRKTYPKYFFGGGSVRRFGYSLSNSVELSTENLVKILHFEQERLRLE